MGNLFAWLFIGLIVFGIIVYADPQIWEDVKGKIIAILTPNAEPCPQINVSMEERGELTISGKKYDGWTVRGYATCRKGTKEGENLNKYYCGGFTCIVPICAANAYVEKTIILDTGDIGETYKHVIWNVYDENKNFVETKCLGDPDEVDEKQAKAFYKELLKWS